MRLSGALGFTWHDIKSEHDYSHIDLKPHPWRRLKTSGSKRLILMVGAAHKAVKIVHWHMVSQF
jgi:hypothetical protein